MTRTEIQMLHLATTRDDHGVEASELSPPEIAAMEALVSTAHMGRIDTLYFALPLAWSVTGALA